MDRKQSPDETTEKSRKTIEELLLQDRDLCDVCFVVGNQNAKIYAHKLILALSSPVFKSMFFSELKETKFEIVIPDLTAAGFGNLKNYIYTKQTQFPMYELFESHMAATKYLVSDMIEHIMDRLKSSLGVSNCCIVYDQMLAFKSKLDGPIEDYKVKCVAIIERNAEEAFKSDTFVMISQQTLINILNFKILRIPEIDLLKACLKWTDAEARRRGQEKNGRKTVFEDIKNLIAFKVLTLEELGQVEIEIYLSDEQVASIFLNLSNKSKPSTVSFTSKRMIFKLYSVWPREKFSILGFSSESLTVRFSLTINITAYLDTMHILPIRNVRSVTLEISAENRRLLSRSKVCGYEQNVKFALERMPMLPGLNYKMEFTFQPIRDSCRHCGASASAITVSQEKALKTEDGEFAFQISNINGNFCIQKLTFYPFCFEN